MLEELYIFIVCLYQTVFFYEIKSFSVFIVILTLRGIYSTSAHQSKEAGHSPSCTHWAEPFVRLYLWKS